MEYKPGSANVVADALSRAPQQETDKHSLEEVLLITGLREPSLHLVQEEQMKDREFVQLIEFLETKKLPKDPAEEK